MGYPKDTTPVDDMDLSNAGDSTQAGIECGLRRVWAASAAKLVGHFSGSRYSGAGRFGRTNMTASMRT